ncbi:unnamed protein product [Arabis nemorensis]|uniref:Uncharacterized protein n=1 Tax=Arabis nemorensis TaxID=586526 RepID=A0A565BKQ7_9BRAS|nr:unnamed protein product [Arabis nemorensis]
MAINDYLAGFKKAGANVSDDRFRELDENFEKFLSTNNLEAEARETESATVAKYAATGEELTPLDGLPVIPTAQS